MMPPSIIGTLPKTYRAVATTLLSGKDDPDFEARWAEQKRKEQEDLLARLDAIKARFLNGIFYDLEMDLLQKIADRRLLTREDQRRARICDLWDQLREKLQEAREAILEDTWNLQAFRHVQYLNEQISALLEPETLTGMGVRRGNAGRHALLYGSPEEIHQRREDVRQFVSSEIRAGRKRGVAKRAFEKFGEKYPEHITNIRTVYRYLQDQTKLR
jgi:hypothetical protein